ncbi:hypothetical protein Nepgr_004032 [Nepenthes gracilis]|uniref:Uncharacterized protein n=1 Tax=Nepenthes gracilis TaxID=150966 RepID=A0AAD3S0P9_NEPGR|nr:hypothetical protein Nepgr_004032 [Nepenthes gracilis]
MVLNTVSCLVDPLMRILILGILAGPMLGCNEEFWCGVGSAIMGRCYCGVWWGNCVLYFVLRPSARLLDVLPDGLCCLGVVTSCSLDNLLRKAVHEADWLL